MFKAMLQMQPEWIRIQQIIETQAPRTTSRWSDPRATHLEQRSEASQEHYLQASCYKRREANSLRSELEKCAEQCWINCLTEAKIG